MKKVSIKELSKDARELLSEAEQVGGLVVEDENGRPRSRVYAYPETTEAERHAAWQRMQEFQENVQQSFEEQGIDEDDLDRLIQEER